MSPKRYLLPGAFSRHSVTILGFPSRASFPARFREPACGEIASLAAAISEFEPVRLYAQPSDVGMAQSLVGHSIRKSRGNTKNISIIPFATNHLWVRDTGPVYVRSTDEANRHSRFAVDFNFEEWGNKDDVPIYDDHDWPVLDHRQLQENATFAQRVIESDNDPSPVTRVHSKLSLEGGALVVDGEGTLLATESSILNPNRNPNLSRDEVETELCQKLGVEKIIWFPGKAGLDVTDVHVDAEVNFIRPGVVVVSRPHPTASKNWWQVHNEVLTTLQQATDAKGRKLEIHIVDEPNPNCLASSLLSEEPATNYVNFYFVNGGLILPHFGDKDADEKALDLFHKLCPDRVVRPVEVRALPSGGGVIHCATQQVIDIAAE
ncbi:hypothetical protein SVAN01_09681 [Stagonosporopsis vannaccii]|nr:hypothetical protein SVAN01_09681 [Stagonosporopsis vannaccii]